MNNIKHMTGGDKKQKNESTADKSAITKKTTVKTVTKKTVPKKMENKMESEKKSRSFKALFVDPTGSVIMEGRYCGAKPKQAACKALSGIYKTFKEGKGKVTGEIKFGVKECTRGSKCKFYWYSGERKTLDEPITLKINKGSDGKGKEITYYYNNVVKKESEDNCKHLLNYNEKTDEPKTGGKQKSKSKTAPKAPVKKSTKTKVTKETTKTTKQ